MSSKLSSSNPYMRDPVVRQQSVLASVASSSAIEGIHAPFKQGTEVLRSDAQSSTLSSAAPQRHLNRAKP